MGGIRIHSAQVVKHSRDGSRTCMDVGNCRSGREEHGHVAPVESASSLSSPIGRIFEVLDSITFNSGVTREHLFSSPRVIRSSICAAFCQFHGMAHDHLKPGLSETMTAPGRSSTASYSVHFISCRCCSRDGEISSVFSDRANSMRKPGSPFFRAAGMLHTYVASKTSCGISRRPQNLHFHPESRSLTKPY
jgi:hypothetical protein